MNNIKTLSGHLTALDKKAIKLLLVSKTFHAKVNRKIYKIEAIDGDLFKVKATHNESNDYGVMVKRVYISTFRLVA
jgi:phage antirepressor YoqD-like protein